jgi:NAD(P)-dependent dehydrogenase (short-subunit alcohol dehydrogenase family)
MDSIREKTVVLVTGGGDGLGRAIATAFAAQKYPVAITGRTQSKLDSVVAEISDRGGAAVGFASDVTQREQVEELNRKITERLGPVGILVNNAGIARAAGFLEMDDSLWETIIRVNVHGTYNCCKVFLPRMIAAKWGRIINMGSTMSKTAYSHVSAYVTSKHAVLGLTRALAVETATSGVTVNAVCPGYVNTGLTHHNAELLAERRGMPLEQALEILARTSPQKRLIEADEVASLILMLASDAAKGITGQAINVDGGAVMV